MIEGLPQHKKSLFLPIKTLLGVNDVPYKRFAVKLSVDKKSRGHYVCREAWLRFLGVGKQRLLRTKRRHRGVDERTLNFGYLFEVLHCVQSM